MVLGSGQDDDHGNEGRDNKADVNGKIGGKDEPPVPVALLKLTRSLSAGHTASGIFPSNTNTKEETIGG